MEQLELEVEKKGLMPLDEKVVAWLARGRVTRSYTYCELCLCSLPTDYYESQAHQGMHDEDG